MTAVASSGVRVWSASAMSATGVVSARSASSPGGLQQGEEGPPRVQHGHGVWLAPTSALVSTKAIARYTRNPITTTAMARPVVS